MTSSVMPNFTVIGVHLYITIRDHANLDKFENLRGSCTNPFTNHDKISHTKAGTHCTHLCAKFRPDRFKIPNFSTFSTSAYRGGTT